LGEEKRKRRKVRIMSTNLPYLAKNTEKLRRTENKFATAAYCDTTKENETRLRERKNSQTEALLSRYSTTRTWIGGRRRGLGVVVSTKVRNKIRHRRWVE
jgi:hypothetical protein